MLKLQRSFRPFARSSLPQPRSQPCRHCSSLPVPEPSAGDRSTASHTFQYGELVSLYDPVKKRSYTYALEQSKVQNISSGSVSHDAIAKASPGQPLATSLGGTATAHRLSLEDYILSHMPRKATPTYPKDAVAMIHMLDVSQGMRVLEAGSGSGAMSLYLSKAVGPGGSVVSFDNQATHSKRARDNYTAWTAANRTRGFPRDNVTFVVGDICEVDQPPELADLLQDSSFDAVALDMMEPWRCMGTIARVLKTDGCVAVYLPNVSQVLSLLRGIHDEQLPFAYDRSMEVIHRRWTFAQAGGRSLEKKEKAPDATGAEDGVPEPERDKQVLWLARPAHEQDTHTAFLLQLRRLYGNSPPQLHLRRTR